MKKNESETTRLRHVLSEREKELDALYKLAALFNGPTGNIRRVLRTVATLLRASMQFPDATLVEMDAGEYHVSVGDPSGSTVDTCRSSRSAGRGHAARIDVSYREGAGTESSRLRIEERERRLVTATASLLADLLKRIELNATLRESTRALKQRSEELALKNVALREVLAEIEVEKRMQLRDARTHLEMHVLPLLHELAVSCGSDSHSLARVAQIEASLGSLFTAADRGIVELAGILSPREVEICGLIRNGLSTREISSYLRIAETTVERHRNTIRRKLDLTGSKTNLTSYLRSGS